MTRETSRNHKFTEYTALIAIGLALLLAIFAFSTLEASAKTTYTEGALNYTIDDGSITITGYFGTDTTVTVPSIIAGNPVNTIAAGAFAGTAATTVNLPDTVTTIEPGAFTVGTEIVSNYNTGNATKEEAAEDPEDEGGTGADYSNTEEGDTVKVGDVEMTVTSTDGDRIYLADANGRTYHSNGSSIIDDETHKPLEGDVKITHKNGTEEVYTNLGGKTGIQKIKPFIGALVIALLIVLGIVLAKLYLKKRTEM